MKTAIDISNIVYGTGVSVYTKNLVKNLLGVDRKNKYILFAGTLRRKKDILNFAKTLKGNFEVKIFPFPPTLADLFWNRLHILPIESFVGKIDLYHSSDWAQAPSSAKKITTIHDLAPILLPNETHPKIVAVHKRRLNLVKKEVDKIIVPSQATKKDLIKLGFKQEIVVIPEAAEDFFKHTPNKSSEKYLLSYGTSKRKNITRVKKAASQLNLELKIIGQPPLGFVTNEKLISLYSNALCLVYPSLMEGFGLPILQAFKCGCPVVTSNTSSLPEVAGDAAILVDPYSVTSIKNGITSAIKNRNTLIKKGIVQAKKFTWQKSARETLKVYQS